MVKLRPFWLANCFIFSLRSVLAKRSIYPPALANANFQSMLMVRNAVLNEVKVSPNCIGVISHLTSMQVLVALL